MDTLTAMKLRKSTRCYHPRPVESEKIEELIAAANHAPRIGPFHLSVIENPALLKELNDVTFAAMIEFEKNFPRKRASLKGYQPLYGAPVVFLFSAPDSDPYKTVNVACAAANMTVAATALDLGSCYVGSPLLGLAAEPELGKKIGIPEGYSPICGVLAGYSAGEAFTVPKMTENTVNYCR